MIRKQGTEENKLGAMTLRHGDCLELMSRIPAGSVDMVLTDIPYDVVSRNSGGLRNLDKGAADIKTFSLSALLSGYGRLAPRSLYIFCATEQVSELRNGLVGLGYTTRLGVWEKTNPSPMNGQTLWLSGVECCVFGRIKGAVFNEMRSKTKVLQKPILSNNPRDFPR